MAEEDKKGARAPRPSDRIVEMVSQWHEENPGGTRRECADAIGASYESVCLAARRIGGWEWACRRVPLTADEVRRWRSENPFGSRGECAEALGRTYAEVSHLAAQMGEDWPRKARTEVLREGRGAAFERAVSWHRENPKGTRRECAEALGIPYRVVCEGAKRLCPEWKGNFGRSRDNRTRELVRQWHDENPDGTRRQCADALGIPYPTVASWSRGLDWPTEDAAKRARAEAWLGENPGSSPEDVAAACGVSLPLARDVVIGAAIEKRERP